MKKLLYDVLRREFPEDTVDISDGYQDNIHVLVVSRRFDAMTEHEKQEMMWKLIDSAELKEEEANLISLVLPLSPAQIK